jgi:hypothetical protein
VAVVVAWERGLVDPSLADVDTGLDLGELVDGMCRQLDATLQAMDLLLGAMRGTSSQIPEPKPLRGPDTTPANGSSAEPRGRWKSLILTALRGGPQSIRALEVLARAAVYAKSPAHWASLVSTLCYPGSPIIQLKRGVYRRREADDGLGRHAVRRRGGSRVDTRGGKP